MSYVVFFDRDQVAAFVMLEDASLWAEEAADRFMDEPIDKRPYKRVQLRNIDEVLETWDLTDDEVSNRIAAIDMDCNTSKTQFRVLSVIERMTIRDVLQEHAKRIEGASLDVLRSINATTFSDDDASHKIDDLRRVMTRQEKQANDLRLLGEFIRRNHTVVHCLITIPEISL